MFKPSIGLRLSLLCALAAAPALRAQDDAAKPPVAKPAQAAKPAPIRLPQATPKPSTSATTPTTTPAAATTPRPATATAPKPAAPPQAAAQPAPDTTHGPLNRTTVVIDPGHGGSDTGARINDSLTEKDVTLALAFRLRSLLSARGFTVVMTRDSDNLSPTATTLALDDRAGTANHARAGACLLLHATAGGAGVHLYTSELQPAPGEAAQIPWLTAQAAWVPQSQRLAAQLATALGRARIPLVQSRASVRPVDSLTCPALVVELAPNGSDVGSLADGAYQGRVAEAIANALVFWQNQVQAPVRILPPAPSPDATTTPEAVTP
jgi:N-acetylmuramoyl-L-alanine amidase